MPLGMTKDDIMGAITEADAERLKYKALLEEILIGYLTPYTTEINGKDCKDLARRAWVAVFHYDDNE